MTSVPCKFFFQSHFDSSKLSEIETEINASLFEIDRGYYDRQLPEDTKSSNMKFSQLHCEQADEHDAKAELLSKRVPVVTALLDNVRPEVYKYQARNYMLNTLANPISLTILDGRNPGSWQILVDRKSRKNIAQAGLLKQYLRGKLDDNNDHVFDHFEQFEKFANSTSGVHHRLGTVQNSVNFQNPFDNQFTHLERSSFEFDALAKIRELEESNDSLSVHEKSYLDSLKSSVNTHFVFAPKYFKEPSGLLDFKNLGSHHDSRFFNGAVFQDRHEAQLLLNSLIRTFQKFLKANGLTCWLAHGSLYGYLYNGMSFPWDNDFDVQMPIRDLHILAQHFNQTLVLEDPREGNGRFFLDVGSSITVRIQGNGKNNIDARFIDIDSGLYIDITALSVSSAMLPKSYESHFDSIKDSIGTVAQHRDPNLIENKTDIPLQLLRNQLENDPSYSAIQKVAVEDVIKSLGEKLSKSDSPSKFYSAEQRYNLNYELDLYNCRNHHFLHFEMISPLMLTRFHGVPALVPNKLIGALRKEYRVPARFKSLSHKGHKFVAKFGSWCPSSAANKAKNSDEKNKDLPMINSTLDNLGNEDARLIYKNLAVAGEIEALSHVHNSWLFGAYRLKEIQIHYANFTLQEKIKALRQLDDNIGPRLNSYMNDPYVHHLQREIWRELTLDYRPSPESLQALDLQAAQQLTDWTVSMSHNELPLSEISDNPEMQAVFKKLGSIDREVAFSKDPEWAFPEE